MRSAGAISLICSCSVLSLDYYQESFSLLLEVSSQKESEENKQQNHHSNNQKSKSEARGKNRGGRVKKHNRVDRRGEQAVTTFKRKVANLGFKKKLSHTKVRPQVYQQQVSLLLVETVFWGTRSFFLLCFFFLQTVNKTN